jgi:hypothetical protein
VRRVLERFSGLSITRGFCSAFNSRGIPLPAGSHGTIPSNGIPTIETPPIKSPSNISSKLARLTTCMLRHSLPEIP